MSPRRAAPAATRANANAQANAHANANVKVIAIAIANIGPATNVRTGPKAASGIGLPSAVRSQAHLISHHARCITSPNFWPLSFRPSHTMAVDSPSNRKPKAAPCSQLKRVMNWV